jgi:hypothetical protein
MFFTTETQQVYFQASIISLATSVILQLLIVWIQNRKLGTFRVLKESVPILLGFKPAVDAYRVAKGVRMEAQQTLETMAEMTYIKGIELFAEAIPSVIIQIMALTTLSADETVPTGAAISLVVSALSTGFISASISYDWDTDPNRRIQTPHFYGYVPAKASRRTFVFIMMMFFSAGMLLIKCTTIVLLGLLGQKWAFSYIGIDLGLFLTIKIVRDDFIYWLPLEGFLAIAMSFFVRVVVKIVADFTSIVHLRHPNEVRTQ